MKFNRNLFFLQFVGIALWLINLNLHIVSVLKGKLISIIFVVLGIIFIMFHLTVIMIEYYDGIKRVIID